MADSSFHAQRRSLSDRPYSTPAASLRNPSKLERKRAWWRNAFLNCVFIAGWFFFAIVLSMYNKWMFGPDHFGFPFPLFVTTFHMLVQFALAALLRFAWPRHFKPDRSPSLRDYATKAAPTGVATGLDIGLSNTSMRTITLSFYTMVKSSSLIFVLFFAFLFHLETPSLRLFAVITIITSGVVLMVATETQFELGGFLLVLSGSALGGLRWSLTQVLMKNRKLGVDNPAATIFWLAPTMGATLALISMIWDGWIRVFSSEFFEGPRVLLTAVLLIAPGVLAFCMVMSEFCIIKRAGVVPMSIAGIAKEVATIAFSAWFFGDTLTPLNITGVGVTVIGIGLYTYHKYRKSVDSTVLLDAHGNPIEETSEDGGYVELGETERLTLGDPESDDRSAIFDAEDVHDEQRTLFEVGDDDEPDEFRSVNSAKIGLQRARTENSKPLSPSSGSPPVDRGVS